MNSLRAAYIWKTNMAVITASVAGSKMLFVRTGSVMVVVWVVRAVAVVVTVVVSVSVAVVSRVIVRAASARLHVVQTMK